MNRPGVGPQNLRSNPGNVFQSQQQSTSQRGGTGTLGSGRLQNGKLGNQQSWAFGMGAAVAPGSLSQSRTSTGLSGFAQAIGASQSQSQAPLDPSDFPSLGGGPGSQQNNSTTQSFWGSSNPRIPPSNQTQRSQRDGTQASSQAIGAPSQGPLGRSHQPEPDSHFSQLAPGLDDFPSLGGLGGNDLAALRRGDPGHGLHNTPQINGTGFGSGSTLSRSSTLGRMDVAPDRLGQVGERMLSPTNGFTRSTPTTRSPQEQGAHDGFPGAERNSGDRPAQNSHHNFAHHQLPYRTNQPSHADHITNQAPPSQMTDAEKFGLPGLMDILRGNISTDQSAIALGMDLSNLGLDLNRNESLHKDWAGPFSDPTGMPAVPDFGLPQAYTVSNVPPLRSKIPQFSDDTLFMIFYQMPRDEHQQLAAAELYHRDWRWHKVREQWMMKCRDAPDPQLMPPHRERGWYYFWDASRWQRDRKELVLDYEDLYHPVEPEVIERAMGSPGA